MNEIFVDVLGYEGLYKVSNLGNVLSVKRNKLLKPHKINRGYLLIGLHKNGKQKNYYVHRLVASAFLPNPLNYKEINHISEIKTDNRVENLEWCNRSYNQKYGTRTQRAVAKTLQNPNWMASIKKSKEKLSKAVLQFTKQGEFVAEYPSTREAERQTGIHHTSIGQCCLGNYKSASGYIWKYKSVS